MLNYLYTLCLGLIQGITEFLPISSTAHLIVCNAVWGQKHFSFLSAQEQAFYFVLLQLGNILALFFYFRFQILHILLGLFGRSKQGLTLLSHLLIAFMPAALIGIFLDNILQQYTYRPKILPIGLVLGSILILLTRRAQSSSTSFSLNILSLKKALLIGLMQCLAFIPGFSRSLMTLLGGIWVGLPLSIALEFSFLLGLMTQCASIGYKGLKNFSLLLHQVQSLDTLLGICICLLTSLFVIRFAFQFIQAKGLFPFAYYRILLAVVLWVVI